MDSMRLLSIFLSFMMVLAPICTYADTPELQGKVTSLEKDQVAPYSGVLLDPIAASKMLLDPKYLRLEIELSLSKDFQQELANKRLAYDLLKVEHDSSVKYHEGAIKLKDQHIMNLNQMLKEEVGNNNTHWWALGGAALGILMSIGVFYASVEIAR
jgi:hypothetical protein